MVAPFRTWTVLPHGRLHEIAGNILTVTGDVPMPVGDISRRMTVVRLKDGRLVIFSAMALDENEMLFLEDFGVPAFLIVPGAHHRLDARPWKLRYPQIRVIAPSGAREEIAKAVAVDDSKADFGDSDVRLVDVPGTRARELALEVSGADGTTLVLSDIAANIQSASGFSGWLLKLMKFAGDAPQIPLSTRMTVIQDKPALAAYLRNWADRPSLARVLVSHGAPITVDPAGALRQLAASLD
jgi:hypothetical protein